MAQADKKKKITRLCSIMRWALNKDRTNGGKEWSWAYSTGINACVCTYGWGIREFSATEWAYPDDLFCFKRRREQSDNNRECRTLVLRQTHIHTSQDYVRTYLPLSVSVPLAQCNSNNKLYSLLWLVMINTVCSPEPSNVWGLTACHLKTICLC